MVVATARQRVATATAVTEGAVNLIASILLARRFGAWGVAAGTLIGSLASIAMHFGVSMHFTRNLDISRAQLFFKGIARPFVMAIPAALLLPYWWLTGPPAMRPLTWIILAVTTLLLVWFVAITTTDRDFIRMKLQRTA
jgi:O-antigen/teichoic acid export membrane protein